MSPEYDSLHPHSLTLALLMVSEAQQRRYQYELEHPAYEVLDRATSLAGYTDEAKADLYARMAESVDPKQPFLLVQQAISKCLVANRKEFPHG